MIFQHTISGIPCQIFIFDVTFIPASNLSPHQCASDIDYYGDFDCDFTVLDRKGYKADWLAKKLSSQDILDIKEIAEKKIKEAENDI